MTQRVGLLNGENLTFDSDISAPALAILKPGVIEGLEIKDGIVTKGKALIKVKRDNNQELIVNFENTSDLAIDTTGTKKIYVEINSKAVNDGSQNSEDGTGIGEIKIGASLPSQNFIKLAEVNNDIITDCRTFIDLQEKFNLTKEGNIFNTANKLVKLDENGKLPPLSGERLTNVKTENKNLCGEFIAGEDAIIEGIKAICLFEGKIYIADKDKIGKKDFIGFIKENLVKGNKIKVNNFGSITGFDNLVIGNDYFLGNDGNITPEGEIKNKIGVASTENELTISKTCRYNVEQGGEYPIGQNSSEVIAGCTLIQSINFKKTTHKIALKWMGTTNGENYNGYLDVKIIKKEGSCINDINKYYNDSDFNIKIQASDVNALNTGDYLELNLTEPLEGDYRILLREYPSGQNRMLFNSNPRINGQEIYFYSVGNIYGYNKDYIHIKYEYDNWSNDLFGDEIVATEEEKSSLNNIEGFIKIRINGKDKKIPYFPI